MFNFCADVLQTVSTNLVHALLLLSDLWTDCRGKQPRYAARFCTTAVPATLLLFAKCTAC